MPSCFRNDAICFSVSCCFISTILTFEVVIFPLLNKTSSAMVIPKCLCSMRADTIGPNPAKRAANDMVLRCGIAFRSISFSNWHVTEYFKVLMRAFKGLAFASTCFRRYSSNVMPSASTTVSGRFSDAAISSVSCADTFSARRRENNM